MYSNTVCIYGMKHQARCITAQLADAENHRFLVGTVALRETNEVHLIELNEEVNELNCVGQFTHPNEIWSLAASPKDPDLLFTVYNTGQEFKGGLWRMPNNPNAADDHELQPLEEVVALPDGADGQRLRMVLWNPSEESSGTSLLSVHDNTLRLWALDHSMALKEELKISQAATQRVTAVVWDPHHPKEVALASTDCSIIGMDLRSNKQTHCIEHAHSQAIRDLDYNPNKPYHLVTGGDDCKIKFWDVRKSAEPLKILSEHSHWVWQVKYNRFHDQLVLSSSTDSLVNLWRVSSISSAPLLELDDENSEQDVADVKIRSFDGHEDSVYSVSWSACDAWCFASLSYDGRVALNHVPSTEKYKILL